MRFLTGGVRVAAALALSLAVAACATSAGKPASGFLTNAIARAYMPL